MEIAGVIVLTVLLNAFEHLWVPRDLQLTQLHINKLNYDSSYSIPSTAIHLSFAVFFYFHHPTLVKIATLRRELTASKRQESLALAQADGLRREVRTDGYACAVAASGEAVAPSLMSLYLLVFVNGSRCGCHLLCFMCGDCGIWNSSDCSL